MSEIEELIEKVKNKIPNIVVFQRTDLGEKPFEFGVLDFFLEENVNRKILVEIQHGLIFACYSTETFPDEEQLKYKDTAKWIYNYFNQI